MADPQTSSPKRPVSPQRSGFDYAGTYRDMTQMHDLTSPPTEQDAQRLLRTKPVDPEPHDVVLYLGCNVLRNSDMVRTVTDIFDLLGLDYIAVGGPTYCCGIMQSRQGDNAVANHMGRQTIDYLQSFRPKQVVMWCPSCMFYYDEVFEADTPFQAQHATEFLVDQLDRVEFKVEVPRRVAMHYHINREQRRRESLAAQTLLRAVPGLEYIEIGSDEEFGTICSPQLGLGPPWQARVDKQLAGAEAAGADTLATIYHGCQRLICVNEEHSPLQIEHYLRLFGRALGIEHEDRYKKYRLWRDPARVMEEMTPCMQAADIEPERALALAQRYFPAVDADG